MLKIAKTTILAANESTDIISALKEQQYDTETLLDVSQHYFK